MLPRGLYRLEDAADCGVTGPSVSIVDAEYVGEGVDSTHVGGECELGVPTPTSKSSFGTDGAGDEDGSLSYVYRTS